MPPPPHIPEAWVITTVHCKVAVGSKGRTPMERSSLLIPVHTLHSLSPISISGWPWIPTAMTLTPRAQGYRSNDVGVDSCRVQIWNRYSSLLLRVTLMLLLPVCCDLLLTTVPDSDASNVLHAWFLEYCHCSMQRHCRGQWSRYIYYHCYRC